MMPSVVDHCARHKVRVQVNVAQHERVELQNILTLNLRHELTDLLQTQGESLGWIRDKQSEQIFVKILSPEICIKLDLGEEEMTLAREANVDQEKLVHGRVDLQAIQAKEEERLTVLLEDVETDYNLAFNDLISRCYISALKKLAPTMGSVVGESEEIGQTEHTYTVLLRTGS